MGSSQPEQRAVLGAVLCCPLPPSPWSHCHAQKGPQLVQQGPLPAHHDPTTGASLRSRACPLPSLPLFDWAGTRVELLHW